MAELDGDNARINTTSAPTTSQSPVFDTAWLTQSSKKFLFEKIFL